MIYDALTYLIWLCIGLGAVCVEVIAIGDNVADAGAVVGTIVLAVLS